MEHSQQYDEINTIVMLGDYIDRGPQNKEVVEFLMTNPFTGFKHVYLKGNHEDMLLKSLYSETDKIVIDNTVLDRTNMRISFIRNGGDMTLESYGITDLQKILSAPEEVAAAFDIHRDWFMNLEPYYITNGYMFVHAGIMPGLLIEDQDINTMMWIRNRFLNSKEQHEFMIIHGHTPTIHRGIGTNPEVKSNRINIDTGSYQSGILTAVCLDEAHIEQPVFINTQYSTLGGM